MRPAELGELLFGNGCVGVPVAALACLASSDQRYHSHHAYAAYGVVDLEH